MRADDGAAAVVAGECHQLLKESRRKQIRVAAPALMPRADDPVRVLAEHLHNARHRLLPELRLVGHHIQNAVAAAHGLGAEPDGMAESKVWPVVVDGRKAKLPGQLLNVLILAHHGHGGKPRAGHGFERPPDERFAVQLGRELVAAEAPPAARRHDETAERKRLFHRFASLSLSTKQYTHFWA